MVFSLAGGLTLVGDLQAYGRYGSRPLIAEESEGAALALPVVGEAQPAEGAQLEGNAEAQPLRSVDELQHEANFFGGQYIEVTRQIDNLFEDPEHTIMKSDTPENRKELQLLKARQAELVDKYNAVGDDLNAARQATGVTNETLSTDSAVNQGVDEAPLEEFGVKENQIEGQDLLGEDATLGEEKVTRAATRATVRRSTPTPTPSLRVMEKKVLDSETAVANTSAALLQARATKNKGLIQEKQNEFNKAFQTNKAVHAEAQFLFPGRDLSPKSPPRR